jgi:hypothetical protein
MSVSSPELILSWNKECISLAQQLLEAIEKERLGLVSFDMGLITSSTAQKTSLMNRLKEKREALRKLATVRYGKPLDQIQEELPTELSNQWKEDLMKWRRLWEELSRRSQANQGLLKHSLKNLDLLLGNLKQLLGRPGIYNQTGKRQDLTGSGKVLEGRF